MGNYLQMAKAQQVLALWELDWSDRRIEAETGVRRATVSRYDVARRAKAAKVFPGSDASPSDAVEGGASDDASNAAKVFAGSRRPRASAASYRDAITETLDAGLSAQRIWQGPGRGVRRWRQRRVGDAIRAHARAPAPRGRCLSPCARRRRPGGLLPGRAAAARGDRRVAAAVGIPHDARSFTARLRRSSGRSTARDLPAAARACVSGLRRRPARDPP